MTIEEQMDAEGESARRGRPGKGNASHQRSRLHRHLRRPSAPWMSCGSAVEAAGGGAG